MKKSNLQKSWEFLMKELSGEHVDDLYKAYFKENDTNLQIQYCKDASDSLKEIICNGNNKEKLTKTYLLQVAAASILFVLKHEEMKKEKEKEEKE